MLLKHHWSKQHKRSQIRGHRRTLFTVQEINLKVHADAILTQIAWPALGIEPRAVHKQPFKPAVYCVKPQGQPGQGFTTVHRVTTKNEHRKSSLCQYSATVSSCNIYLCAALLCSHEFIALHHPSGCRRPVDVWFQLLTLSTLSSLVVRTAATLICTLLTQDFGAATRNSR